MKRRKGEETMPAVQGVGWEELVLAEGTVDEKGGQARTLVRVQVGAG